MFRLEVDKNSCVFSFLCCREIIINIINQHLIIQHHQFILSFFFLSLDFDRLSIYILVSETFEVRLFRSVSFTSFYSRFYLSIGIFKLLTRSTWVTVLSLYYHFYIAINIYHLT